MFPRSAGEPGRHGTFRDCEARLEYVASMGFDVLYLPPIHPIGRTGRKGRNNTLAAGPDDVGSPWAIGAAEGGHKAVHPDLGTIEDFRRFVARAREHGLEIALDVAFLWSEHGVVECNPGPRGAQPHRTCLAAWWHCVAAGPRIHGAFDTHHRMLGDLFAAAGAGVDHAVLTQLVERRVIRRRALALIDDRPVPLEAELLEAAQN